ncbi:hypothetical protein EDB19DRAFT_1917790 [Suillus lakei]|nr:hypothetical protein EDB19DRAFT_1917790 [Suillus lakei]
MGLGFVSISALPETTPLCHLSELLFSFHLKHDVNQASQISAAQGVVLILGGVPEHHWSAIALVSRFTVQGKMITIDPPSGLAIRELLTSPLMLSAAIDTGTTLIGAPTPIDASIWAQVPDSMSQPEISKAYMHSVTCDTNVTVHISVGRTVDMNLGTLNDTMIGNANATSQMCACCIFDVGIGGTPVWIVGDTPEKCVPRLLC